MLLSGVSNHRTRTSGGKESAGLGIEFKDVEYAQPSPTFDVSPVRFHRHSTLVKKEKPPLLA